MGPDAQPRDEGTVCCVQNALWKSLLLVRTEGDYKEQLLALVIRTCSMKGEPRCPVRTQELFAEDTAPDDKDKGAEGGEGAMDVDGGAEDGERTQLPGGHCHRADARRNEGEIRL